MDPTGEIAIRALREIREDCGQVCEEFEIYQHPACQSSVSAWMIADAALNDIKAFGDWFTEYLSRPVDQEKLAEQVRREREVAVSAIETPRGASRPSADWPKLEHPHAGWGLEDLTHTHSLPPHQHRHSGYESVRGVS